MIYDITLSYKIGSRWIEPDRSKVKLFDGEGEDRTYRSIPEDVHSVEGMFQKIICRVFHKFLSQRFILNKFTEYLIGMTWKDGMTSIDLKSRITIKNVRKIGKSGKPQC